VFLRHLVTPKGTTLDPYARIDLEAFGAVGVNQFGRYRSFPVGTSARPASVW